MELKEVPNFNALYIGEYLDAIFSQILVSDLKKKNTFFFHSKTLLYLK